MPRIVTRAEFARLAGVSRVAVTKAAARQLAAACSADRIDADHPAAVAYLEQRRGARPGSSARAPTTSRKAAPRRPPAPPARGPTAAESPPVRRAARRRSPRKPPPEQKRITLDRLDELEADLAPIVEKWGTGRDIRDQLLALKELQVIRGKRLANEETEGRLISRDLVRTHVIGVIDAGNRRLLHDAPKTIAREVYAQAAAKVDVEQAEQTVRDIIGSQLAPVKTSAARLLRGDGDTDEGGADA